jgi:hypothetical protein
MEKDKKSKNTFFAGGNHNRFIISNEILEEGVILKRTSDWEVAAYETIFSDENRDSKYESNCQLRKFVP